MLFVILNKSACQRFVQYVCTRLPQTRVQVHHHMLRSKENNRISRLCSFVLITESVLLLSDVISLT